MSSLNYGLSDSKEVAIFCTLKYLPKLKNIVQIPKHTQTMCAGTELSSISPDIQYVQYQFDTAYTVYAWRFNWPTNIHCKVFYTNPLIL